MIKLLLLMSVLGCGVLAPLHCLAYDASHGHGHEGEGGGEAEGDAAAGQQPGLLGRSSAYDLPHNSWVLWVDLAMFYCFSLLMFRFIDHLQSSVRHKFKAIESQSGATACTAAITGFPALPWRLRRSAGGGGAAAEAEAAVETTVATTAAVGAALTEYLRLLYGARAVISCVAVPR